MFNDNKNINSIIIVLTITIYELLQLILQNNNIIELKKKVSY